MPEIAVRVEHLSKRYRLGQKKAGYRTLRDSFAEGFNRPLRRLTSAASMSSGARNAAAETANFMWALNDVSFDVKQGEVLGIIGRNGAGKSTLLKILSRITEPSLGRVRMKGKVGALLEVGTGFHPELTGRENIYLNAAILGMKRQEVLRKFDEIVAFAEVEQFIDTPVKHYSSGMGLRLGFSVAAHLEPEILIVDEVLAVGDAAFQKKCLGKMDEVANDGRTVLFVSHNLGVVNELTTSALWLNNGRVEALGPTYEVTQAYLQSFDQVQSGFVEFTDSSQALRSISVMHNGIPVSSVSMGESIQFRVTFQSDRPIFRPHLGIGIDHLEKGRVLSLSTTLVDCLNQPLSTTSGSFVCTVDQLMLNQGTYFVTIQLKEGAKDSARIERACRFEVVPDDVFGTGAVLSKNQGVFYQPHTWEYKPE